MFLLGCQPPDRAHPLDAPGTDATFDNQPQIDVPGRDKRGCEPGAHVDCFWHTPSCQDGVVRIPIHRPVYYCTNAEALRAYRQGVCEQMAPRYSCRSGRCAALNSRMAACLARYDPTRFTFDELCEGTVRGEGETCAGGRQCFDSTVHPEAALRCDLDAGRCVRAARADRAAGVGGDCTEDVDCERGTVCAQHGDCRWRCTAVLDGGIAYDAAHDGS